MQPERAPPAGATLAEVKRAVMALVTGPEAPGPEVEALIVGDARASARERVMVYAHMYRARLTEALDAQFPRLARRLGPAAFGELACAYIADEPSRHPSLRFLGARLPGWLAARRPEAPALVGLAALEWARADVFDLLDERTLTLAEARALPPERLAELPLRLIAAHRLVTAPRGTAAGWSAAGADTAPTAPGQSDRGPTETLLVWRQETMVFHRCVDDAERAALDLAAGGTSLGLLCDGILAAGPREGEVIARVHGWLSIWLADGLLVAPRAPGVTGASAGT